MTILDQLSIDLKAWISEDSKSIAKILKNPGRGLLEARSNAKELVSPDGGFYLCVIVTEDRGQTFRCWPFYFNEVWGHTTSTESRKLTEDNVYEMLCPSILDHEAIEWHVRGDSTTYSTSTYKNIA